MSVDVTTSNTSTTAPLTSTSMRPATRYVPTQASSYEVPPPHNIGVLKPPRPTVSLDPRPVLIPILSSVICFPIVAFAIICLLRYRALRLRKKEHQRRLRGGMRSARLEIPGREKPSLFSRDSSSGDTTSRPPGQEEESSGRRPRLASSSSDEDEDFASEVLARRSNNNHVKFGAAAAILHVPGIPSPRSSSARRTSSPRRSSSPRSAGSPRSPSVSFLDVVGVVGDSDDDADDEDDLETTDAR